MVSTSTSNKLIAATLLFATCLAALIIWGFDVLALIGAMAAGLALAGAHLALGQVITTFKIRNLATAMLGSALGLIFVGLWARVLTPLTPWIAPNLLPVFALAKLLLSMYAAGYGALIAFKSGEKLQATIPFVRLKTQEPVFRSILLDSSSLQDPRIYDIASTGIFDKRLAIPRFIADEANTSVPLEEGHVKSKPRKVGEVIRKLEELTHLDLRMIDDDGTHNKDPLQRLLHLAEKTGADILTSERYRLQPATAEAVRIINIHTLASALRPLMQAGETLTIKVQRYGKEIKQGVGYLEDGTMVVINGGGDYLGETIKAQVLSIKHTSSGRMIFCNALASDTSYLTPTESDVEAESEEIEYSDKAENGSSFFGPKTL